MIPYVRKSDGPEGGALVVVKCNPHQLQGDMLGTKNSARSRGFKRLEMKETPSGFSFAVPPEILNDPQWDGFVNYMRRKP